MTSASAARLALSEAAIALIRHAESNNASGLPMPRPRILTNAMGASTDPAAWLREAALIRLVSVIEAYVDAVSMYRMNAVIGAGAPLVSLLVGDFERASNGSWGDRHDAYKRYHGISLRSLSGWQPINAGIHVRNCLLHGLGNLTARQRDMTTLAVSLKLIDVTIGGNRMHLSGSTVAKVAAGCEHFVGALDAEVVPSLPARSATPPPPPSI